MAINLYYKATTHGLDKIIKSIQVSLQSKLKWVGDVDIYGKLQKTERNNNLMYEYWISNNDYKEVFIDDKRAGIIGFVVNNPRRINGYWIECDCDCIATVDIKKIYNNTSRYDEKAIQDLKTALEKSNYVLSINSIKEGIRDVFNEISIERIKHRDMQPYFVFSVNFTIKYNEDDC